MKTRIDVEVEVDASDVLAALRIAYVRKLDIRVKTSSQRSGMKWANHIDIHGCWLYREYQEGTGTPPVYHEGRQATAIERQDWAALARVERIIKDLDVNGGDHGST